MSNQQKANFRPSNEIDMQLHTTTPFISSEQVSDELANKFREFALNENGETICIKDYWGIIKTRTQDLRLSNLDRGELNYINYHMDLCDDVMTLMPPTFNRVGMLLLGRVSTRVETAQSKFGFFRKLFNTMFQHQSIKDETAEKRGFWGFGKKKQEGN